MCVLCGCCVCAFVRFVNNVCSESLASNLLPQTLKHSNRKTAFFFPHQKRECQQTFKFLEGVKHAKLDTRLATKQIQLCGDFLSQGRQRRVDAERKVCQLHKNISICKNK